MISRKMASSRMEKPVEGHRGMLVYQQEYGYKFITMTVSMYPGEQSTVSTHAYDLDYPEEAEHIPSDPPLASVDLYHFPVADETEIMLTIKNQLGGEHRARYTVHPDGVEEHSSFLWLSIVRSSDSVRDTRTQAPGEFAAEQ